MYGKPGYSKQEYNKDVVSKDNQGYNKPELVKTVYGDGKRQSEENIIKSVRNPFKLKK